MTIRRALELASFTLGHGMEHWLGTAFFLILPFVTQEFSLSLTEAGLLITYRNLISSIFNLPAGAIIDRLGKRRLVLGLAIMVSSLAYYGIGFSNSYLVLQAGITLVGITNVFWHPAAISSLTDRFPERKGFGLSFHELGATIGEGIAPIVVGFALLHLPWRTVAQIHLIPGALIAVMLWLVVADLRQGESKQARGGSYWAGLVTMLRDRGQIALGIISGTRVMAQSALSTFLPLYLILGIGQSADTAGFYVSLLTLPSIVSGLIVGPVSDRVGRKPVIRFGLTLSSLMLVALGLTRSGPLFAGALILLGLFLFSMRPVIMAYAVELAPPGLSGTAVGMQFLITSSMSALAPVAAGALADWIKVSAGIQTGLLSVFYFCAAVVLLGDLLAFFATREPARAAPIRPEQRPAGRA